MCPAPGAVGRPGLGVIADREAVVQFALLQHLADDRVHQDHDRVQISVGQVERQRHEIVAFLHAPGREGQQLVVAVPAALDGLEIVRLAGQDGPEPGASALDVDDHAGQFAGGNVGQALLLEADAGAGG